MIDWGNFSIFFSTGIPLEVLWLSLIITAVLLIVGYKWSRVNNKKKDTLWVLLVEYAFVVVCSTIICRKPMCFEFDRLELTPFWIYNSVLTHVPGVSVWDIVLNVALFLPFVFLVKLLAPSLSLIKILGLAIICSLIIETNQYVFEKGIAHIDDAMHNVIGTAIGWLVAKTVLECSSKRNINTLS